jgi:ADP-heptose:LPS heptosyltransferase
LIIRSPAQEGLAHRIPGLKKVMKETEFLNLPPQERANVYNLRDHPLQSQFVWGSPEFYAEYPGFGIGDIIRVICKDLGIQDGQANLLPLNAIQRADSAGKIILIPGTAAPIKRWSSANWLRLHQELKLIGIDSVMIGEPRVNSQIAGLMKSGMPWIPTRTLADALDAISSSLGVVSVDTGLMHLAVHQGLKTVALFREYTMFLREYPHAKSLLAQSCAQECRAGEFSFAPNASTFFTDWGSDQIFSHWNALQCRVPEDQSCMSTITVEKVLAQL